MSMKRRAFLAAGAAVAAVGCDQIWKSGNSSNSGNSTAQSNKPLSGNSAAQGNKTLNLYSARHYDADNQVYEGFFKKTGIKINLVEAPADKLIERVKSEGANSPADVLITVDAGNLWRIQKEGLLQRVPSSSLLYTQVPTNLQDPGGYWFGLTKRARVIVYNKDRIKPSDITRYEDLTDPNWRGKMLTRSSGNVYNQSLTGSIIAALGESEAENWAKGVVANFARKPEGNDTAQIKAVAAGIGDLAIANTYYVVRLAKSSKPEERDIASKVGVIFPNQGDRGTHINISGGGIAKSAPNPEAAMQYLEYLVSPEAQQIFAGSNYEYPVLQGVPGDAVLTSLGSFKEDRVAAKAFGERNEVALKLMDRAGWA
ncbi:MAG TPA: Fe(3+) ABC transporter substrate-binding protein [Thermosynechococcaceae cyanobacterium]